jgi:hypothetical protein
MGLTKQEVGVGYPFQIAYFILEHQKSIIYILKWRQVGATGEFWTFIIQRYSIMLGLSREFIFKQFMSTERREHAHCNEHKHVSRD